MKLRRSLHGLKDAAKIYNQLLFALLNQLGFKEIDTTPCIFNRRGIINICYIDDLFLFARYEGIIEKIRRELSKRFCVKDFGKPEQILGMDLNWVLEGSLLK